MSRLLLIVAIAACGAPAKPLGNASELSKPDYRIEKTPGGPELGVVIDLQKPRTVPYFTIYVVARTDGTQAAALVPRPDTELAGSCTTKNELSDIARRAGLCDVPVSEGAFVERVNQLPIEDALRVKRFLELELRFEAIEEQAGWWKVWPFPHKHDVTAICTRVGRGGLSEDLCEFWSPQHMTEEMRFFSEADTKLLAQRLNELYGLN
jgi:hypothetical protein